MMTKPKTERGEVVGRMARFSIEMQFEVELGESVFSVMTDEWRNHFYPLFTREQVAEHIAYNLIRDVGLSRLDGFADMGDGLARLVARSVDLQAREEVTLKPRKAPKK